MSDDGFYYVPQANISRAWAHGPNHCHHGPQGDNNQSSTHWPTPFDGTSLFRRTFGYSDDFYCFAPHGTECAHGAVAIRCTHSAGHVWPFFGTLGGAANQEWAELLWWFFSNHPRRGDTSRPI